MLTAFTAGVFIGGMDGVDDRESASQHPVGSTDRGHAPLSFLTQYNPDFCIRCGAEADGIEPDVCEACGEPGVYGAAELALMVL